MSSLPFFMNRDKTPKRSRARDAQQRLAFETFEDRRMLAAFTFDEVQAIGNGLDSTSAQGGLVTDLDGSSYVAGYFEGAVDFDPSRVHAGDADWLISVGEGRDLFVAKYDPQGDLQWARALETDVTDASTPERVNEIALDQQGNLYVTGDFADTLQVGAHTIASAGRYDGFLLKFNAAGDALWATSWGTSLRETGSSVTVGPAGEVYVAGVSDDDTTTPVGTTLVRRFDPANGDVLWSRSVDSGSYSPRVGADSLGNVNLASVFYEPFDADPGAAVLTLTHGEAERSEASTYVLQLDASGDLNWARAFEMGTPSNSSYLSFAFSQRLAVDNDDNLILVGQHAGIVDFDPSATASASVEVSTGTATYVAKLSQQGDYQWVASTAASGAVFTNRAVQVDAANNVVVAGYLRSYSAESPIIDFDPGPGFAGFTLSSNASSSLFDSYVWSLSSGGEFRSLDHLGAPGSSVQVLGLDIDSANGLQIAGSFVGSIDFDPDAGVQTVSTPARSAFVLRLDAASGITISRRQGHATAESGQATSFEVSLDSAPTADVSIPVSSSDLSEGNANVSELLFTPSNWQTPQTVWVSGANDAIVDGDMTYSIVFGAAVSLDPAYHGLKADDVAVTNLDDDVPTTKFYVVDDAKVDRTYEYAADGASIENYSLASGNTSPRGAASTAAGDKVWVVDANRSVFVYDVNGGLLGSWTAGSMASKATPEGIATNGTDVWIVDGKSDKVFKYSGAATRLSGSQNAVSSFNLTNGNTSPKDIVTDGASLWVVNDSTTDKVFKYGMSGSLLGSWTISSDNSKPTGITIDPSGASQDIWIVDSGTDRVYQYANGRAKTSGSLAAAAAFGLAVGNTNPQGIADPPRTQREATPSDVEPLTLGLQAASGSYGPERSRSVLSNSPQKDGTQRVAIDGNSPSPRTAGLSPARHSVIHGGESESGIGDLEWELSETAYDVALARCRGGVASADSWELVAEDILSRRGIGWA